MPRPDRTTQIRISRVVADKLRRLAADHGYVQTRGIMAGELGSIAQLFEAVARGELEVRSQVRSEPQSSAQNAAQEGATEAK